MTDLPNNPTPQAQFRVVIPGSDGAGDEVFEANSQDELNKKMAEAKGHATQKINEQAQEITRLQEEQRVLEAAAQEPDPTPAANGAFNKEHYFTLMASDPLAANKYISGFTFKVDNIDTLVDEFPTIRRGAMTAIQQQINGAFVGRHPELVATSSQDQLKNSETITEILTKNKWAYSVENLEAAYAVAKASNTLKLQDAPTPKEDPLPNDPQNPAPTVITNTPTGQPAPKATDTEKYIQSGSLDEVREHLRQREAAGELK